MIADRRFYDWVRRARHRSPEAVHLALLLVTGWPVDLEPPRRVLS